jgi:uncharacterized DUF497 family protein
LPSTAFAEAMSVFRDPLVLSRLDDDSAVEARWVTLGMTSTGNLVVVVHTWTDIDADRTAARIISARWPTRKEARQYHEDPLP